MIAAVVLALAHYSITTTRPLAQQRFDAGLTYLYASTGPTLRSSLTAQL